jgi:FolB domain-containing protein
VGENVNSLFIRDLKASCIIGVRPEERNRKQTVVVSLELYCTELPGRYSDDLEDTVDYSEMSKRVAALVEGSSYQLIEALAEAVTELCLSEERVVEAVVRVEKPGAVAAAKTVGVEIRKTRER